MGAPSQHSVSFVKSLCFGRTADFRGTDGLVYLGRNVSGSWPAPFAMPPSTLLVKAGSDPEVARGLGLDAEIIVVDSSGVPQHVRMAIAANGIAFFGPVAIGGTNLAHVAVSKGP